VVADTQAMPVNVATPASMLWVCQVEPPSVVCKITPAGTWPSFVSVWLTATQSINETHDTSLTLEAAGGYCLDTVQFGDVAADDGIGAPIATMSATAITRICMALLHL
jgi:hypothetical protein